MNYITLVNEMIDYIEENLSQTIYVEELSNRFFISKYYLTRIFKAVTNDTIKEYIDKRRITEAAKKLVNNESNIIDVAFECGYPSHETFTRQFKRVFSITPTTFKKRGLGILGYERLNVIERDFKNLNKDLVVDFKIVHKKELKLYGRKKQFDATKETSIIKLIPFVEEFVADYINKRDICRMYNVVTSEEVIGELEYFVGFKSQEAIKEVGLYEMLIPETSYAVFKYGVDLSEIHKTVINDICRTIVISEFSFNKIGIEFFLVFEKDYFETNQYEIYVPVD